MHSESGNCFEGEERPVRVSSDRLREDGTQESGLCRYEAAFWPSSSLTSQFLSLCSENLAYE